MVLIAAVSLFAGAFLLWRLLIHQIAKPESSRWLSDDLCLIALTPTVTALLAFSVAAFVQLGVSSPATAVATAGASIAAAILFLLFGPKQAKPAASLAPANQPQNQDPLASPIQTGDVTGSQAPAANDAGRTPLHAA